MTNAVGPNGLITCARTLHSRRRIAYPRHLTANELVQSLFEYVGLLPLTPVTELADFGNVPFWEIPNIAGLRRQLEMGGWTVERWGRPHLQPYGAGWRMPRFSWRGRTWRTLPRQVLLRAGALHVSVVARRA